MGQCCTDCYRQQSAHGYTHAATYTGHQGNTHTHMHIHSCFCNIIFIKHCCNRLISGELSEFGGGGADLQEEPNTALHTPPSTYSAPAFILWRCTAKLWVKHTHIHTHILKYTLTFINTCICMFLADKGRSYGTLQAEALKLFNVLHQLETEDNPIPQIQGILQTAHDLRPLRDELFCQLIKQTAHHPKPAGPAHICGWRIIACMCCTFSPASRSILKYLKFHFKRSVRILCVWVFCSDWHKVKREKLDNIRSSLAYFLFSGRTVVLLLNKK